MSKTRIGTLLETLPELQNLNRELKKMKDLQNILRDVLPLDLAKCTTVASVKAGTLTLAALTNPVAAKLKQMAPRILLQIRMQHDEITAIIIKMQVLFPPKSLPRKQISMGPQARCALDSLAEKLDSSPLKKAVRRLRER